MRRSSLAVAVVLATVPAAASAAYQHHGETDAATFTSVYPDKAGTKLDSCTLCHKGGSVTSGGKTTTYGSCQWCHQTYGYSAPHGDIRATLNPYGNDYSQDGRNAAALRSIELKDSDNDGHTNAAEIGATRYPGDSSDDPTKIVAPFVVYDKAQLAAMPQHYQFMVMNTTKSGDYYAQYSGVVMGDLLKCARIAPAAYKITAFSPDGYAQGHPLEDSAANLGASYQPYVNGIYPQAPFFYDQTADKAHGGWCDYGSPFAAGRNNGDPIRNRGGLRFILALQGDGKDLAPAHLDSTNRIADEGPFRTITPQKVVGPPDQSKTASSPNVIWPYDANADHNAGFSTKATTMIKVEPLPTGTTDIDVLEASWGYVDQGKLVVYGALQQIALEEPEDGAARAPWRRMTFKWRRGWDPDPAAAVSYLLEYTKEDPVKGPWTQVKVAPEPWRPHGNDGAAFFAALLGHGMHFCPGGWGDMLPGLGRRSVVSKPVSLERKTTYHWRVIADGPSSHNVSPVWSFTTGR